ncbi:MAG: S8 family serine peptidase [Coriobacteriales bacterium]|nr:S8 family serine peptidase [Coriobacteriales bacterium]
MRFYRKQVQGQELSQKAIQKTRGRNALRLLLSLLMVALLVPLAPAYAAGETLPDQGEAVVAVALPEVTTLGSEPTAVELSDEAAVELSDEPEPSASQQNATFATLSEATEAGAVAGVPSDPEAYVANEIIVVLAGETAETRELASVEESLVELSETEAAVETEMLSPDLDGSSTALVELPADVSVADALLQLANDESVAFAQPNFLYTLLDDEGFEDESTAEDTSGWEPLQVTNDPLANDANQWWLGTVKAYDAWDAQKTNGAVTVAVIDTGVRISHNDLKNNIHPLAYDAYLKQLLSKSIADGQIGNGGDDNGHGTHVAGIVAAQANNGLLGAGVSYNAKILPIAVSGPGSSITTVTVRHAYDYVIAHRYDANIRVINISLGGYGSEGNDAQIHSRIIQAKDAGILTVCAAGNGDTSTVCYPSDYEEVTSVVSVDKNRQHSSFSDHNEFKDIAAPGGEKPMGGVAGDYLLSTANSGDGATETRYGTSMAAPVVSGIAALLFAKNPTLTPAQVQQALYSTAQDLGDSDRDDYYGHGLVNAQAALAAVAASYTVTFDPNGGSVSPASVIISSGSSIGALPTPVRTGYTFNGWFTTASGGTQINATTTVTANVTYYAHWTVNTYTVTLNSQGGFVSPATIVVAHNATVGTLSTPTRSGYIFEGWYTAASGGTKITPTTRVTANVTYYAQWAANNLTNSIITLSSALNRSRVIDITGASKTQGAAPVLWDNGYKANQRFRLVTQGGGYYLIQNINSGLVLDVYGGQMKNSAALIQWSITGGDNQKWKFVTNTNGSYTIVSKADERFCIDLPGASFALNTKPILYERGANKANQQFYLDVATRPLADGIYTLASAASPSSRFVDIEGSSSKDGARAILWSKTSGNNQKFRLAYDTSTGYYMIVGVASGKPLDVYGASVVEGASIIQWTSNGNFNQRWYIAPASEGGYAIYSASSGLALDVYGGSTAPGASIIQWPYRGAVNQRWVFTGV